MGPNKKKIEALKQKMKELGISNADIEEKFIKASGKGGQKVNKTSSAVFLLHTKTQISVKCSKARSQHLNRFLALRNLVEKIEAKILGKDDPRLKEINKIKKQKQRRKKKTKNKLKTRQADKA